ncbi:MULTISPECIES: hypothetical protein [Nocardia]|uniref:hypothetical protein n=1 Tax=Nocardia TaxID=1817 RepID=UPI0024579495|nr:MULTISPECIES: hypothetical protein [Nocardia]
MSGRRTTAAWIATVAICATGCAAQIPASSTTTQNNCYAKGFTAPFDQVDPCDAEQVLTAALGAIFGYRPSEQADPTAALASARALLEDRFAARAASSALVWAPVTTAVWQQWRTDRVRVATTARVLADDHPPDTATQVARVVTIDIDAPVSDPSAFAVYATATRDSVEMPWLLSGLQVTQ